MRTRRAVVLALLLAMAVLFSTVAAESRRVQWNRPTEPFRIAGNLYYVGAAGVSSFLIVDPLGTVLLDGGLEETAPQIEKNIAALGFRMADIKYIVNSHAHYDHCGGLAKLKRDSAAQMVASKADRQTLESGFQKSYGKGQPAARFPAVKVDREVRDGEQLNVGAMHLTAHLTPGHTPGCTTWSLTVQEKTRTLQVVFYCSMTVAGNDLVSNRKYPNIVGDYRQSFATLSKLPCDVFLGPHPEFFEMDEKRQLQKSDARANPFVRPGELQEFNHQAELAFDEELSKQQATAEHQ